MLKVAFVINSLKNKSGAERVAIELANQLSKTYGYEITIINRDTNQCDVAYSIFENVNVKACSGNLFTFFLKLKNHIQDAKYDFLIVHNMGKLSLFLTLIPNINKIKTLEHVSFVSRPKIVRFFSRLLYKKIDQVITLTENDKSLFAEFHPNVIVIPNFSPFPISSNRNNSSKEILTVGRLTDQKNYIHLLKAWKLIYESILDWKLNIYGDGEQLNFLKGYIENHSLKNVFLKGVTSNVKEVYEQSSFFVMSSKYEGLPMVLIEAQSFGLPIVSYDCPFGPSDVIQNHKNGFLVENQNIEALADAILQLASSPDMLAQFSQNSLINAKKYQPEQILKVWIEKVLEG